MRKLWKKYKEWRELRALDKELRSLRLPDIQVRRRFGVYTVVDFIFDDATVTALEYPTPKEGQPFLYSWLPTSGRAPDEPLCEEALTEWNRQRARRFIAYLLTIDRGSVQGGILYIFRRGIQKKALRLEFLISGKLR